MSEDFGTKEETLRREEEKDELDLYGDSFEDAEKKVQPIPYGKVEYLYDISLELCIEFGKSRITLKEALSLKPGSLCMLNRHMGELVNIVIGKKIMAKGEVVIVNERYGIRISEVTR